MPSLFANENSRSIVPDTFLKGRLASRRVIIYLFRAFAPRAKHVLVTYAQKRRPLHLVCQDGATRCHSRAAGGGAGATSDGRGSTRPALFFSRKLKHALNYMEKTLPMTPPPPPSRSGWERGTDLFLCPRIPATRVALDRPDHPSRQTPSVPPAVKIG